MDRYCTAEFFSTDLYSSAFTKIQQCIIKNPCNYINILSKIAKDFSGIFRSIFKRDQLKLYLWIKFLYFGK